MVQDEQGQHRFSDEDREVVEHVLPPGEDANRVLAAVEDALHDLADLDLSLDDPAKLDVARQELPSDPHVARILSAALPEPLNSAFEYVEPSEKQSGYWRKARVRTDLEQLSTAELRQRRAFTRSRIDNRHEEGTTETTDGRRIPSSVAETGDELAGRDFHDPDDDEYTAEEQRRGRRILDRIRSLL